MITNRTECCRERIVGCEIALLDADAVPLRTWTVPDEPAMRTARVLLMEWMNNYNLTVIGDTGDPS